MQWEAYRNSARIDLGDKPTWGTYFVCTSRRGKSTSFCTLVKKSDVTGLLKLSIRSDPSFVWDTLMTFCSRGRENAAEVESTCTFRHRCHAENKMAHAS